MSIVFWALWLQHSLGFSALLTGFALLPAAVPYIITSKIGGTLLDRYSPRLPLIIGTITFFIGLLWITICAPFANYYLFLVGMLFFGAGWGMIRPCGILSAINSVPPAHKSMASGILNTLRQFGAGLGFAIIYAVISTSYNYMLKKIISSNHLSISVHKESTLIALHTNNPVYTHLISTLRHSYTISFTFGMIAACVFALLNVILAISFIR